MPVGDTSHYKNPQVDAMMLAAKKEVDHDKRVQMYHKIQAMILDDAPWVFVNSTLQVRAHRKDVKGFRLNPTQMFFDMDQVSLQN